MSTSTPPLKPPQSSSNKAQLIWCITNPFISIYCYSSIQSLTDYLNLTFYKGIDGDYTKLYFIGGFISFITFNQIAQRLLFSKRLVIIIFLLALAYLGIFLLSLFKNITYEFKRIPFLILIFLVGYLEIHLQNSFIIKGSFLGKFYILVIIVSMSVAAVSPNLLVLICQLIFGPTSFHMQAYVVWSIGILFFLIWVRQYSYIMKNNLADLQIEKMSDCEESIRSLGKNSVDNKEQKYDENNMLQVVYEHDDEPISPLIQNSPMLRNLSPLKNSNQKSTRATTNHFVTDNSNSDVQTMPLVTYQTKSLEIKINSCNSDSDDAKNSEVYQSNNKDNTDEMLDVVSYKDMVQAIYSKGYLLIGNYLIFLTSLGIFPVLVFKVGFVYNGQVILSPLSQSFACGDVVGRFVGSYYHFTAKLIIISYYLLRLAFFPIYFILLDYDQKIGTFWVSLLNILLTITLGFTNGHAVTTIYAKNQEETNFSLLKSSNFLLSFLMFFGLASGSLISCFYS